MGVSATGSSSSFGQFGSSTLAFSGAQQLKGLGASIDSSLLTQTFGSSAAAGAIPGMPASTSESGDSTTALLAAYASTKSLSPVALAYLQQMPTSSTTSTLL